MNLSFPTIDNFDLDDAEQALYEYLLRLEFLENKLQAEFEDAMKAWRNSEDLEERLQREFDAMTRLGVENQRVDYSTPIPTLAINLIYSPAAARGEIESEAMRLNAETAAGSLILMADDVVQRLRHSIFDASTGSPRPTEFTLHRLLDSGVHAATLIWAAGNAYRHGKDWKGLIDNSGNAVETHPEFKRSKLTRDILSGSTGLQPAHDGSICVATLSLLSVHLQHAEFGRLWENLIGIGRDFAQTYCRNGSYEKVEEALEFQRNYAGLDLSFADDIEDAEDEAATD